VIYTQGLKRYRVLYWGAIHEENHFFREDSSHPFPGAFNSFSRLWHDVLMVQSIMSCLPHITSLIFCRRCSAALPEVQLGLRDVNIDNRVSPAPSIASSSFPNPRTNSPQRFHYRFASLNWQRPIVSHSAALFSQRVAHSWAIYKFQLRAGMASRKGTQQKYSASKREVLPSPRNNPPHWPSQAPSNLPISNMIHGFQK
jgi:hypothetical protein